jgi:hypothetical protein
MLLLFSLTPPPRDILGPYFKIGHGRLPPHTSTSLSHSTLTKLNNYNVEGSFLITQ